MPIVWNAENTTKLLLKIIQNHYIGTPDYDRLAREWGSDVSPASLKIQFCKMRREAVKEGRISKTPKSGSRVKKVKEEKDESE